MNLHPQGVYDVPPSRSSVDSQSFSSQKRNSGSISSGYSNMICTKSQDHDSGFHSIGSGRTPPMLDGPPVRLDKHPSIRRKRDSDPCLIRRSSSVQSPCSSFSENLEPPFECEDMPPGHASHPDSPPGGDDIVTGHMDGDSAESGGVNNGRRAYDEVRPRSNSHPYYTPQATEGGRGEVEGEGEYMRMIHPKARTEGTYVVMRSASQSSMEPSSTIPVPARSQSGPPGDHYNTLQHFSNGSAGRQSARVIDSQNYETLPNKMLPTISERGGVRRENYENRADPQLRELRETAPRMYRPNYENHHEASFRGRRGSHGQESYENVGSVSANSNGNNNNIHRQRSFQIQH